MRKAHLKTKWFEDNFIKETHDMYEYKKEETRQKHMKE